MMLGIHKRVMWEKVAKYGKTMLLDVGFSTFLNIGLLQALDLETCRYLQQQVSTNGNSISCIS